MLICTVSVESQSNGNYSFDKITTEMYQLQSGISQNSIRIIFQDKDGFLWLGTWEGLNRYDGVDFVIFNPDVKSPEVTISHQAINAITQDKDNFLWIGTEGGLNSLEPNTYKISHIKSSRNGKVLEDSIRSLFVDDKNNLWVGMQNGLLIFDSKRINAYTIKEFYNVKKNLLDKHEIRIIKQDGNKNIWIGTEEGVFYISHNTGLIQKFDNTDSSPFKLTNNRITTIDFSGDSIVFVGTENGFNILNVNTVKCKRFFESNKTDSLNKAIILSTVFQTKFKLWIGTSGGGINIFDLNTYTFESFEMHSFEGNPKSNEVDDKFISYLFKDRQGIIWAGTSFTGIIKINERQKLFQTFRKGNKNTKGLNSNNVWSFLNTESELWIGTENGVNIYHKKKHNFRYLKATVGGLSSNKIRSMVKDSYGNIWIGTFDNGLNKLNISTGKIDHYNTHSKYKISNDAIWTIKDDNKGNLWVGTYSGLNKINIKTNEIEVFYNNPIKPNSLANNVIYKIFIDSKKNLWIGTYDGLCLYHPETNDFSTFKHIQGKHNSLSTNKIFDIYEDKLGNLWIGTMGGGLNKLNLKTKNVKFFTTENGLPNNIVYAVIEDNQGNLWLSTNKGISQFNMFEETFVNYNVIDGVQSNEFNLGAQLKDEKGNIYLGGIFGFNVFNPADIIKSSKTPPVVISSFKTLEKSEYYGLKMGDTLYLDYNDNVFTIKYAALDYSNSTKNQYKHILKNYDRDWSHTTAINSYASYARVPAGTYVFQVYGSNSDGRWTSEALTFTIIIKPPWYDTLWFKISLIFFALVIISSLILNRFRRIRKKHQIEKQLFDLERQSLRLQMNPHFIFNTLNSIQNFVLNNNQDNSVRYLSKFSRLMRLMLQNSQETLVSLSQEIELLTYYLDLEKLRFNNKFNYTIEMDKKIDADFCGIPPTLMQPYIENAILHGVQHRTDTLGLIQLKFYLYQQNILVCEIIDNGLGRKFTTELKQKTGLTHNSKGMLITKERLALLNRDMEGQLNVEVIDLFDDKNLPSGTKIRLHIKFQEI